MYMRNRCASYDLPATSFGLCMSDMANKPTPNIPNRTCGCQLQYSSSACQMAGMCTSKHCLWSVLHCEHIKGGAVAHEQHHARLLWCTQVHGLGVGDAVGICTNEEGDLVVESNTPRVRQATVRPTYGAAAVHNMPTPPPGKAESFSTGELFLVSTLVGMPPCLPFPAGIASLPLIPTPPRFPIVSSLQASSEALPRLDATPMSSPAPFQCLAWMYEWCSVF